MSDNTPQPQEYFDESFLSMSDEEFAASFGSEDRPAAVVDSGDSDPDTALADAAAILEEEGLDVVDSPDEGSVDDLDEEDEDGDPEEIEDGEGTEPEESLEDGEEGEENAPDPENESSEGIDYKAEFERLTAPFKASGREMQVKTVDEAIQLMQMGVDYYKKIRTLKPNLRYIKMLENHQLLDEEKLSYLIDLSQNNVAAINKLLRDSNVDPLELDPDSDNTYTPSPLAVDDREIELDLVMEEIKESPSFAQTLNVVSKQWDTASKREIAETPQILKIIDSHISSGIFDVVQKELDRQRLFGGLDGMSDLEAYRAVGDSIQAKGGFDHLFSDQRKVTKPAPSQRKVIQPNASRATDSGRHNRRRAATPAKSSAAQSNSEINYLAMSDEEFEKLVDTSGL